MKCIVDGNRFLEILTIVIIFSLMRLREQGSNVSFCASFEEKKWFIFITDIFIQRNI